MYARILIAVDGSDEARRAARRGLHLAAAFDAAVDVVSVVPPKARRLTRNADERVQLRERAESALGAVESLAADLDIAVRTSLLEGSPAVRIPEYADGEECDLVVVGRQGLTGLGRRILGGVTEQILQRTRVPVLVVPDGPDDDGDPGQYERILLPTDGSDNAAVAVPHAVAVAERSGATLDVLNVVDLQAAGGVFNAGGLDRAFVERLEAEGQAAVDAVAAEVVDATSNLVVETAVERTDDGDGVAAGIREYAAASDADLVVMGSHGRSNLERQLLGSVASGVLRSVDVPVLVVPRAA